MEPGCTAHITEAGNIRIDVGGGGGGGASEALDPIQLAIFSHRFMGIAEQMGRTLQRTAVSVNIKERLDFSCALFGRDGGLVANAPHLPVHLGAMQEAVKFQATAAHPDPAPTDLTPHLTDSIRWHTWTNPISYDAHSPWSTGAYLVHIKAALGNRAGFAAHALAAQPL